MHKWLFTGIVIVAIIAAAIALRLHDAPYIAVIKGERVAATEGLSRKAERGDGFAALLVAQNYSRGVMGAANREKAIDWYLTAAKANEIRAVVPFVGMTLTRETATPDRCKTFVSLLDHVGRTGELAALLALGRYYETGLCVVTDLAMAARYYLSAVRIDGRFHERVEMIARQIGPDAMRDLTPEPFDVAPNVALAQFLAVAPALR